jgi:hypothetical protein
MIGNANQNASSCCAVPAARNTMEIRFFRSGSAILTTKPTNQLVALTPDPLGRSQLTEVKIQGYRLNAQLKRVVEHPHLQLLQRISPRALPHLLNGQAKCFAGLKNQNRESGYYSPTLPTGGQPWNFKIHSLIHWIEESTHTSETKSAR